MFGLAFAIDNVSKLLKVFGVIKITFEKIAHNLKKKFSEIGIINQCIKLGIRGESKEEIWERSQMCYFVVFFFRCIMCNLKYRFCLQYFHHWHEHQFCKCSYERVYNFDFCEHIFWYRNDQKFKKKNKDNLNHMKEQIQDAIILWPWPSLMTLTSLFLILH